MTRATSSSGPEVTSDGRPWGPRVRARALRPNNALSHLAMGIFLTMLGFVLSLDRFELVDASRALRWWPLGFHVLGVTMLLRRPDSRGRFWGIAWIAVGTWLLLASLDVLHIDLGDLLGPGLLILIGVRLMTRGRRAPSVAEDDALSRPSLIALLAEARRSVTQEFEGASMTSVMGGCHLDLRQASIPSGRVPVVDVFAVMGGHGIIVPATWTVVLEALSILAAAEDKRLPLVGTPPPGGSGATILVRGTLIFGGLTVKN